MIRKNFNNNIKDKLKSTNNEFPSLDLGLKEINNRNYKYSKVQKTVKTLYILQICILIFLNLKTIIQVEL